MKRIRTQLLLLLLSICAIGCMLLFAAPKVTAQTEEAEERTSIFRGLDADEMFIGGFIGPRAAYYRNGQLIYEGLKDDTAFRLIKEAGFNYICDNDFSYSGDMLADAKKALQYAEDNGLMYLMPAYDVMQVVSESMASDREIAAKLQAMYCYDSFGGLYLRDEPYSTMYPFIEKCLDKLEAIEGHLGYKDLCYYLNLLPPMSADVLSNGTDSTMTWEDYIRGLSQIGAEYLSFDMYPLKGATGQAASGWFDTLGTINRVAKEEGKPWIGYVQVGGGATSYGSDHYRIINEGEMRWDVYTMLAFGAKGLNYYLLVSPPYFANTEEWELDNHCLINVYGEKTDYWYYAKNINAQVNAIDHILLNAEHKGVIVSGSSPCTYSGEDKLTEYCGLKKVIGRALIGCFDYNGQAAYLVVNNNFTGKSSISLELDGEYVYRVIRSGQEEKRNGSKIELVFEPGDCAVVLLEGCHISFNLNYESKTAKEISHKEILDGQYGILPIPERIGTAFVGWYKDHHYTGNRVELDDSVDASHTLYARWCTFDGEVAVLAANANGKVSRKWTDGKRYWECSVADFSEPCDFYIGWEDRTAVALTFDLCYQLSNGGTIAAEETQFSLIGISNTGEKILLQYQLADDSGNQSANIQSGIWYTASVATESADMIAISINDGNELQNGVLFLEGFQIGRKPIEESADKPFIQNAWLPIVVCSPLTFTAILLLIGKAKRKKEK